MKKKLGAILLALVLAVSLGVVPVTASNGSWVLYGTIGGQNLVTINETTGDATLEYALSGSQDSVNAIAFDATSGTLYGLARSGGNHRPQLATIDVDTGNVTIVGTITLSGYTVYFAEGLAVDPSGTIYVSMSINGDFGPGSDYYSETLATVNPTTAVATSIGTISPTIQTEADGLEFVDSTLYATDDPGSGPTNIYTIDTSTAAATFKGTLSSPHFKNVNDMAYNPGSGLLYGYDPGVYGGSYPRHLCTISHPGTAAATDIGETHTAAEFGGGYMSGVAWVFIEPEGPSIEVEKDYRYTDVCFEKDNDLDGEFSEDPVEEEIDNDGDGDFSEDPVDGIDNDGDGLIDEDPSEQIDNDGDGLIDEDPVDCPLGTDLGTPLPTDADGNYLLEAVIHPRNDKVKSYNPGQYYAVSTVNVPVDIDTLTIVEDWSACSGISVLNPPNGGGSVVIVQVGPDGVARQILDAHSPGVTVDPAAGTATAVLGNVPAGTTILMYVKFGPGLKGVVWAGPYGPCINYNSASTAEDPTVPEDWEAAGEDWIVDSANLIVIAKD